MTPEERSLIDGLFDRMKSAAGQPRDAEAEALIARRVQEAPYAAYVLAQTVLVQDHALQQASDRIQQLEAQLAQTQQAQQQDAGAQGGGFLGGLWGGGGRGTSVPTSGSRGAMPLPQQNYQPSGYTAPGYPQQQGSYTSPGYPQGNAQGYAQGNPQGYPQGGPPPAGPWGQQRGGFGGGGFLQGALATAAGVAGGALLFDGIRNLMSGGTGPIAEQAALVDPVEVVPSGDDLGQQAQNALGGDPGTGGDPWGAAPQDASYDDSQDDGGWDAGGGDDSSWT